MYILLKVRNLEIDFRIGTTIELIINQAKLAKVCQ